MNMWCVLNKYKYAGNGKKVDKMNVAHINRA